MEPEEEKKKEGSSYRYWVREATADAAPPPLPQKLSNNDVALSANAPASLGSLWNRAGTWEEKNLTKWATDRLKELLGSVSSLQFSSGKAEIRDVNRCVGDKSQAMAPKAEKKPAEKKPASDKPVEDKSKAGKKLPKEASAVGDKKKSIETYKIYIFKIYSLLVIHFLI